MCSCFAAVARIPTLRCGLTRGGSDDAAAVLSRCVVSRVTVGGRLACEALQRGEGATRASPKDCQKGSRVRTVDYIDHIWHVDVLPSALHPGQRLALWL